MLTIQPTLLAGMSPHHYSFILFFLCLTSTFISHISLMQELFQYHFRLRTAVQSSFLWSTSLPFSTNTYTLFSQPSLVSPFDVTVPSRSDLFSLNSPINDTTPMAQSNTSYSLFRLDWSLHIFISTFSLQFTPYSFVMLCPLSTTLTHTTLVVVCCFTTGLQNLHFNFCGILLLRNTRDVSLRFVCPWLCVML